MNLGGDTVSPELACRARPFNWLDSRIASYGHISSVIQIGTRFHRKKGGQRCRCPPLYQSVGLLRLFFRRPTALRAAISRNSRWRARGCGSSFGGRLLILPKIATRLGWAIGLSRNRLSGKLG